MSCTKNESICDKTNNVTATSEDSDQQGLLPGMTRVFIKKSLYIKKIVRPGNGRLGVPFTVNLDWSTVNWVKQHRYRFHSM